MAKHSLRDSGGVMQQLLETFMSQRHQEGVLGGRAAKEYVTDEHMKRRIDNCVVRLGRVLSLEVGSAHFPHCSLSGVNTVHLLSQ